MLPGPRMIPNSFRVRKLIQGRSHSEASSNPDDPLANATAMAGAVYDVSCEQVSLSGEEIAECLEDRRLRSTDLVMIDGTWTSIAESVPFFEVAEPYARRERRVRTVKAAFMLFVSIAAFVSVLLFRIWLSG